MKENKFFDSFFIGTLTGILCADISNAVETHYGFLWSILAFFIIYVTGKIID